MPSKKSEIKPKAKSNTPLPSICYRFSAIGTAWKIDIYQPLTQKQSEELQREIHQRIAVFDQTYSRFRSDSVVTEMSKKTGNFRLPLDAEPLIRLYEDLYKITDGSMTPLIGNVLSEAGYDANYSLRPTNISPAPDWNEAINYDFPYLQIKQPVILDFGAAGKGYLVDIIGKIMQENMINTFCINAGGDILHKTAAMAPIQIGLEHPEDSRLAIGIATIKNQSICGSAGNRRTWDKYHHIIHPKNLESPQHIKALWVVSNDALHSDALSTALFFSPARELAKHYVFEYAIIRDDFSLEKSQNFPAVFFT